MASPENREAPNASEKKPTSTSAATAQTLGKIALAGSQK